MTPDPLAGELRAVPVPDPAAGAERAWPALEAAFATREPVRRRRIGRGSVVALVALVAAAAVAATAVTPPGRAAIDWIRDRVARPTVREVAVAPPPAQLEGLPAAGRLLVTAGSGVWVVRADGSRRRLGLYEGSSWSPRGLFVAAWRGNTLSAIEPGSGDVRWTLQAPATVRTAAWAGPDGVYIAYVAGRELRLVEGDGEPDRALAPAVAPVQPAWQPEGHQLAYVDLQGVLHLHDVDRGRERWQAAVGPGVQSVSWSADGSTLLVVGERRLLWLAARTGATRRALGVDDDATITAAAIGDRPGQVAYATVDANGASELRWSGAAEPLFAGAGRLLDLRFSPDGRWLVASWPDTDQWLFLRTAGGRRVLSATRVTEVFDPGGPAPAVEGWCCAPGG